jgi:predicted amidophosphoribosyltransferase
MKIIEKEGKAIWLERMKDRWSCPACRMEASWWDRSCKNCGAVLRGYKKPSS